MASDDKGRRSPTRVPFSCGYLAREVGGGRAELLLPDAKSPWPLPRGVAQVAPGALPSAGVAALGSVCFAARPQGAPRSTVSSTAARTVTMTRTSSAPAGGGARPRSSTAHGPLPRDTSCNAAGPQTQLEELRGLAGGRAWAAGAARRGRQPVGVCGAHAQPSSHGRASSSGKQPLRRSPAGSWSVRVVSRVGQRNSSVRVPHLVKTVPVPSRPWPPPL